MRHAATAALLAALAAARPAAPQCDDPYDATLCAHTLDAAQEQQFDASDGAVSAFWDELGGDHLDLVPPDDCAAGSCGFTGTDDASVLARAAASREGVYLCVAVADNVWVDWSGGDSYGDDSVDLYFDALDANTIFTCTDCLIGLYNSTLSYTTQQIQVFMGASAAPTQFRMAYYDQGYWSWQTMTLTWDAARTLYGIEVEIVAVDGVTKAQEWFIPWSAFGGGIPPGTDVSDRRFGFCAGYNDMDGDNTSPDKLRWPEAGDPWAGDAQTTNYWGDLLTGPVGAVPVVETAARARPGTMGAVASTETFSLDGRLVSGAASGAVVRRGSLADGRIVARSLAVVR